MEKVLRIAVRGATVLPIGELTPFQGDLKTLARPEYEQFRNSVQEHGFSFVFHVWQHEGKTYIIDGHQRLTGLTMMRDTDGWHIPELPVAIVEAEDFQSAKRKVLAGIAQYGKMTEKSLTTFLKENDIPWDHVVATFTFPTIDMDKVAAMFAAPPVDELPPPPDMGGQLPSGSDGVRQINLFFNDEDHKDFLGIIGQLNAIYKTSNVTDTVLAGMREAAKAHSAH